MTNEEQKLFDDIDSMRKKTTSFTIIKFTLIDKYLTVEV